MTGKKFPTVDDYLASLGPSKRNTLGSLIGHVLEAFPDLDATISWNVPQIHKDGAYVFGLSSAKQHLSLAPWSALVIERFRSRLEGDGYVVRKNLFQVPDDWEIDTELVDDLIRARLDELGGASD